MKVVQVHNWHKVRGGQDVAFAATIELLIRRGIDVLCLTRDSQNLGRKFLGRLRAFTGGLYSPSACREMKEMIRDSSPDVVQVYEIFPFISPWILDVCRRLRVPVIMRCSNFRLICPTAHFFYKDGPCQRCAGGCECWCVLKNCRGNIFESLAYALRTMMARKCKIYQKNVTLFITPSKFVKSRLADIGISQNRIVVIPNMVSVPDCTVDPFYGDYVLYVGRVSPEKGIDTLLAASNLTGLPLHVVGDYTAMPDVVEGTSKNIKFLGFLDQRGVGRLYQRARFVVVPSKCYEAFPNSVLEAMSYGLPVIGSRIGGIPEQIDDGRTGFLFEPGNSEELAIKMRDLWNDAELCQKMGQEGRQKVIEKYREEVYFKKLLAIYERAIEMKRKDGGG